MITALLAKIKAEFLALAFAGALIALQFWPAKDRYSAFCSVFIGTTVSAVSVPGALEFAKWQFVGLPIEALRGPAYFWMGLLGMQIIPIVAFFVKKLGGMAKNADD